MDRRRSGGAGRTRLAVAGAAAVLAIAVLVAVLSGGGTPSLPPPGIAHPAPAGDPFTYVPARASAFAARATAGAGNVLFAKSRGGGGATAPRGEVHRCAVGARVGGPGRGP